MKRALIIAAVLLSPAVAKAEGFWFTGPRGFTYGQTTPGYTWTTGPRGYTFFSTPRPYYAPPANYYGGYGNTYNINYGTVYAPHYYGGR